jgi:hypothetical protein
MTMKKLLSILLLILSITVYSQKTVVVDKKIYTVVYSQKYQSPLTVTYKLYKPKSNVSRGSLDFHTEDGIITIFSMKI